MLSLSLSVLSFWAQREMPDKFFSCCCFVPFQTFRRVYVKQIRLYSIYGADQTVIIFSPHGII